MCDLRSRLLVLLWLSFAGLIAAMSLVRADDGPVVSDAWVRFAGPVVKVHAGYLTLANPGGKPRAVVAAESTAYEEVQLHSSRVVDGVAIMEPVKRIEVAVGGKVRFSPGGLHLMLMRPKQPVPEGGSVSVALLFENGDRLPFTATVKRDEAPRGSHHGHHTKPGM